MTRINPSSCVLGPKIRAPSVPIDSTPKKDIQMIIKYRDAKVILFGYNAKISCPRITSLFKCFWSNYQCP